MAAEPETPRESNKQTNKQTNKQKKTEKGQTPMQMRIFGGNSNMQFACIPMCYGLFA